MDTRKAVRQAVLVLAALGAGVAFAHPNHAEPGTVTTFLHLLTEPDHLLVIIGAVVAAFALAPSRRRDRSARKQRRD
jgi:hydrogenase/urease accessory protein HupE